MRLPALFHKSPFGQHWLKVNFGVNYWLVSKFVFVCMQRAVEKWGEDTRLVCPQASLCDPIWLLSAGVLSLCVWAECPKSDGDLFAFVFVGFGLHFFFARGRVPLSSEPDWIRDNSSLSLS